MKQISQQLRYERQESLHGARVRNPAPLLTPRLCLVLPSTTESKWDPESAATGASILALLVAVCDLVRLTGGPPTVTDEDDGTGILEIGLRTSAVSLRVRAERPSACCKVRAASAAERSVKLRRVGLLSL